MGTKIRFTLDRPAYYRGVEGTVHVLAMDAAKVRNFICSTSANACVIGSEVVHG